MTTTSLALQPTQQGYSDPDPWVRCIEAFFQELYNGHSNSQGSLKCYRSILRSFFTSIAKHPSHATREDVLVFINAPCRSGQRKGLPPTAASRNTRLTVLSSFYKFVANFPIPDKDGKPTPLFNSMLPTAGLKRGKPARHPRVLSLEEVARFLSVIPRESPRGARDYALFTTYFYTSQRLSAIAQLCVGDIEPATFIEHGVSRQGYTYRFFGKGHSKQEQRQELPAPAYQAIQDWLWLSGRTNLEPDDPVFTALGPGNGGGIALDPYKPIGVTSIQMDCKKWAILAGIDPAKICVHSFRHTSARERAAAGEDWRVIQKLLGHSTLSTTDLYLSVIVGQADPGSLKLEQRLASVMGK